MRLRTAFLMVAACLAAGCTPAAEGAADNPSATPTTAVAIDPGPTATTMPTPTPTATPTAIPEATTPPADPNDPPELRTTGDDLKDVMASIEEYRAWLYALPPDPDNADLLDAIYAPVCDCYETERELLEGTAELNATWEGGDETTMSDFEVVEIVGEGRDDGQVAEVLYTDLIADPARLVMPDGEVIFEENSGEVDGRVTLGRQGPDDPWRVLSREAIEERPA